MAIVYYNSSQTNAMGLQVGDLPRPRRECLAALAGATAAYAHLSGYIESVPVDEMKKINRLAQRMV